MSTWPFFTVQTPASCKQQHPLWANRASFTRLPGNVIRITIENPGIRWKPGQHMFLACHSIVPLQSHPFTIATLPDDNNMDRKGMGRTGRFFRYASKHDTVLGTGQVPPAKQGRIVSIDD